MKRILLFLLALIFSFNVNAQSSKYNFFKTTAAKAYVSLASDRGREMENTDSSNSCRKVSSTVCYSWNGSIKSAANVDVYITSDGNLKVKCNDTFYDMKSNYSYDSNSSNPDYISYYKYYIQIESSKFYLNY